MNLIISSLDEMGAHRGQVSHVISVIDPEDREFLPSMGISSDQHLQLFCHDVESRAEALRREREFPGSRCIAPTKALVKKALDFALALPKEATLLVHCAHGISRSPALAFAILCQSEPKLPEKEVLQQVFKLRPHASPHPLIVKHADALLARDGRMSRAL